MKISHRTALSITLATLLSSCNMGDPVDPGLCGVGMSDEDFGTRTCQCAPVDISRSKAILSECGAFIPENATTTGCSTNHVCEFECAPGYMLTPSGLDCIISDSCDEEGSYCVGNQLFLCKDKHASLVETCDLGCEDGKCLKDCTEEDELRCNPGNTTVLECQNNTWTSVQICDIGCQDGKCITECSDLNEKKCSADNTHILECLDNEWSVTDECEFGCNDAECLTEQDQIICEEKTLQCNEDKTAVMECDQNQWSKKEDCPYGCENNACIPSPSGPVCTSTDAPICSSDNTTVLICENGRWINNLRCENGCTGGICNPSIHINDGNEIHAILNLRIKVKAKFLLNGISAANKKLYFYVEDATCISLPSDFATTDEDGAEFEIQGFDKECSTKLTATYANDETIKSTINVIVSEPIDENHNLMFDNYETAPDQGQKCKKHADCESGFCDSMIGNKCSTKCTSDEQCIPLKINGVMENGICRQDGRCASPKLVMQVTLPSTTCSGTCRQRITFAYSGETESSRGRQFSINWGDNSPTQELNNYSSANSVEHSYPVNTTDSPQIYYITVWGEFNNWYPSAFPQFITDVLYFGPAGVSYRFLMGTNIETISAPDIPDASKMTDMSQLFLNASLFNGDINHWDTSNVVNMYSVFNGAKAFNQDIGNWDTSNVTNMDYMFNGAQSFNQKLPNWDVSKVESATDMFKNSGITEETFCSMIQYNPGWSVVRYLNIGINYSCN